MDAATSNNSVIEKGGDVKSPYVLARKLTQKSDYSINESDKAEGEAKGPTQKEIIENFVMEIKAKGEIRSFAPTIFMKIRNMHGI